MLRTTNFIGFANLLLFQCFGYVCSKRADIWCPAMGRHSWVVTDLIGHRVPLLSDAVPSGKGLTDGTAVFSPLHCSVLTFNLITRLFNILIAYCYYSNTEMTFVNKSWICVSDMSDHFADERWVPSSGHSRPHRSLGSHTNRCLFHAFN